MVAALEFLRADRGPVAARLAESRVPKVVVAEGQASFLATTDRVQLGSWDDSLRAPGTTRDGASCLEPAWRRTPLDEHVVGANVVVQLEAVRARRDPTLTVTLEHSVILISTRALP